MAERRVVTGPVTRAIRWITDSAAISVDYARTDYRSLHARYIRPARATDTRRRTLEAPAKPLLDWLATQPGQAVTGVSVTVAGLADLYGCLRRALLLRQRRALVRALAFGCRAARRDHRIPARAASGRPSRRPAQRRR